MLGFDDTLVLVIGLVAISGGAVIAVRPFLTRRKARRTVGAGSAMFELVGIGMICMGLLVFFLGLFGLVRGAAG